MAVGVYMINFLPISQQSLLLITQITTGIISYAVLCQLSRLPSFIESMEMIKPKLSQLCRIH